MDKKNAYCFVLGNNHSLCKVEIINVLFSKGIDFEIVESSQEILVIRSETEIEEKINIDMFGSHSKLVKVYKEIALSYFLENPSRDLVDYDFIDFFVPKEEKHPSFALSVYGAGCRFKDLNSVWYLGPSFCLYIRDELKLSGIKNGFLPLRNRKVSTVSVNKNKLLSNGFEIVLAIGKESVYVGKTIAIQDYESYSFRDYGRPNRDPKSGMIPPKLAKMMINLARTDKNKKILDPFCGSGTILEELILLGYRKIKGSDISGKAIDDSKANIKWLFDNYHQLEKEKYNIQIMKSDVIKISEAVGEKSIDAIVTEPLLGRPRKRYNFDQAKKEIKSLKSLYLKAFNEFKKILKEGGKIVIVSPVFKCQGEFLTLPILEGLRSLGFNQKDFLPKKYSNPKELELLNLELTDRNSIIYYRPEQTVSREIFLFEI